MGLKYGWNIVEKNLGTAKIPQAVSNMVGAVLAVSFDLQRGWGWGVELRV